MVEIPQLVLSNKSSTSSRSCHWAFMKLKEKGTSFPKTDVVMSAASCKSTGKCLGHASMILVLSISYIDCPFHLKNSRQATINKLSNVKNRELLQIFYFHLALLKIYLKIRRKAYQNLELQLQTMTVSEKANYWCEYLFIIELNLFKVSFCNF